MTIIPAIDITVMVNITWTQPNGQKIIIVTNDTGRSRTVNYSYTFDTAQLGRYGCVAKLIPLSSNSNLQQSISSQQGSAQIITGKIIANFCSKLD